MTTEKYLKRLEWLENMIISRSEIVEIGRTRAMNIVAVTDKEPVQTSPKDTMCEIMSNVVDTDKELSRYKAEYKLIMSQVDNLSGAYSSAYLYMRYAKGHNVNMIARALNKSRSTIYRIHREAIEEFEYLYGKTYKQAKNYQSLKHSDTL